MKKVKLNWIYSNLFVLVIVSLAGNNIWAQTIDKTIEKTAHIGSNVLINIENSNFDLNYKTWDKARLKVEYSIHIEAKSNTELNEFYQELEKEIDEQLKGVNSGSLSISYPFKKVIKNGGKVKIQFNNSSKIYQLSEFKASIVVYAPKKNELSLDGSFCSINIDDLEANASIKINSCKFEMGDCKNLKLQSSFCKDMKAGNVEEAELKLNSDGLFLGGIKNNLELNASFSKIEVSKIGGAADIKLNSSTFQSSDLKELNLEGSFVRKFVVNNIERVNITKLNSSEFKAQNIKNLSIENASFSTFRAERIDEFIVNKSSSSKFYINNANVIEAPQCSFSDFTIGLLNKRFIAKSNSGSIKLNQVAEGFEQIKINGQFVNIDIEVNPATGYKIEADLEFPNFRYSDLNFSRKEKDLSSEFLVGWKGNNKDTDAEILLDCKSCSISLD